MLEGEMKSTEDPEGEMLPSSESVSTDPHVSYFGVKRPVLTETVTCMKHYF